MKKTFWLVAFVLFMLNTEAQVSLSTIEGQVRYMNADSTAMHSVKVVLFDASGNRLDSTFTDNFGTYLFQHVITGTYQVKAYPTNPWGGVNTVDALIDLKHFVHINNFSPLLLKAGNVDGSGVINPTDALMIQRRFINLLGGFPAGDWVSESIEFNITTSGIYYHNVKVVCVGDLNGSNIPTNNNLPCPGVPSLTYGGQVYHTVLIGNQCWMKENLNIGTMINGSLDQTNNDTIEKYCYLNDTANCAIYGGLYQWDEMMQYIATEGAKGICPTGWHIPSTSDWNELVAGLGGDNIAGGSLKEEDSIHWLNPNVGANNASGFTGFGSGRRY